MQGRSLQVQDPHKAHIVRPDVVVAGVLVNRGLKGIVVRIHKCSHI